MGIEPMFKNAPLAPSQDQRVMLMEEPSSCRFSVTLQHKQFARYSTNHSLPLAGNTWVATPHCEQLIKTTLYAHATWATNSSVIHSTIFLPSVCCHTVRIRCHIVARGFTWGLTSWAWALRRYHARGDVEVWRGWALRRYPTPASSTEGGVEPPPVSQSLWLTYVK